MSYAIVGKFLSDLKKEFEEGDNKTIKVAKLKKVELESKMIEEFISEFRRVVRKSSYEGRPLIKEIKQDINRVI